MSGLKQESLLQVQDLQISFSSGQDAVKVIRGFSLTVNRGEIVGVLGESGSGKTVSASMLLRLFSPEEASIDAGSVLFNGCDLGRASESDLQSIRGRDISFIFQDPTLALHPAKRIGRQLRETLKAHGLPSSREIIIAALAEVGISDPETIYTMYPFQLSGGQNQRVMICQGMLCRPQLLIADEPTSAVDASLRKHILDLLIRLNTRYHMSILLITHDFDVARYVCNRLVIMYGGLVVEEGLLEDIILAPLHPYTEGLIRCAASLDRNDSLLYSLEGTPITPHDFAPECPFAPRCGFRRPECTVEVPPLLSFSSGSSGTRTVRCLHPVISERLGYRLDVNSGLGSAATASAGDDYPQTAAEKQTGDNHGDA